MAYIPTVWETGDVITAEKLNKAEEGIEAASASAASYDHIISADPANSVSPTVDAETVYGWLSDGDSVGVDLAGFGVVPMLYTGNDDYPYTASYFVDTGTTITAMGLRINHEYSGSQWVTRYELSTGNSRVNYISD